MRRPILALLAALAAGGSTLATRYETGRSVRVETKTALSMETLDFQMERGGEPVEGRFGGRGGGFELERSAAWVDTVLEADGGRPVRVRRRFEEGEAHVAFGGGEEAREHERESPLVDVELLLEGDGDGEVAVEVEDGAEPPAECLEGHRLELALDGLLPQEDAAEGDSWDLDAEAVAAALGLDTARALFPPEEAGPGEGPRGGGGGGRRRFGGRARGGVERLLRDVDWDARATLEDAGAERDGMAVARIALRFEGSGSVDEEGRQAEVEARLEGTLDFSPELGLPLRFEIEGEIETDSRREFDRGGEVMVITSSQAGEYRRQVTVEVTEDDE